MTRNIYELTPKKELKIKNKILEIKTEKKSKDIIKNNIKITKTIKTIKNSINEERFRKRFRDNSADAYT
jgi:hypothetical protein